MLLQKKVSYFENYLTIFLIYYILFFSFKNYFENNFLIYLILVFSSTIFLFLFYPVLSWITLLRKELVNKTGYCIYLIILGLFYFLYFTPISFLKRKRNPALKKNELNTSFMDILETERNIDFKKQF